MSLVLEDPRHNTLLRATSNNVSPSQNSQNDLPSKRFGTKIKVLRADSPTTIEACKELGILIPDLKQKTIDDFKDPNVEEEINELRFNHYMSKYNQMVKDVFMKKRELVKAQHRALKLKQIIQQPDLDNNFSKPRIGTNNGVFNSTALPMLMQHSTSVTHMNNSTSTPVASNFGKALSYFRSSHNTSDVREFADIVGNETSSYGLSENPASFDAALAQEVLKFNKIKMRKQKEAKHVYEEEMKRAQVVLELKEKEKRIKENEKKHALEKKLEKEEKKRRAEDKMDKIKEMDKMFEAKKREERQKMQLKLQDAKQKLAEEAEERKKHMIEQEEKLEQIKKVAEERTSRLKEEELAKCDELMAQINDKFSSSEKMHALAIDEKISRAKLQVQKVEESARRIREKQKQDEEANTQRLVEKLAKKDADLKLFHEKQMKELKRKEKEAASKSARFYDHQAEIKKSQKEKISEMNEKSQKIQEDLKNKKEQAEKSMRYRQELNRLRLLDKQENYQRNIRQTEYEQEKIFQKEKYHQDKLAAAKFEKETVKQAKIEASLQMKIEKQRIDEALIQLSKLTQESYSGALLTEAQKKILRDVLKPTDFKEIELEEKRQKEAQIDAMNAKKMGLASPTAKKHL